MEEDSRGERDRYAVREVYERRRSRRQPYRNGYYKRDFVTRLGTIRLRVARTRGRSFLPRALEPFQRRAEDVAMLIREAFLRGISTRQVGRVVATRTWSTRSRASSFLPSLNMIEALHPLRITGNDAAHRREPLTRDNARMAIGIMEDLLNFLYDLDYKASQVTHASRMGGLRSAKPGSVQ